MPSQPLKVAVIGAGASGITAIKTCLEENLEPTCFERSDHTGGLWRYTDTPVEGQACVMKSTVINTSKEMMAYSDFLIPDKYPVFMHNSQVYEYFCQYIKEFDLERHIRYNTEVVYVKRTPDFKTSGEWEVKSRDRQSGEEKVEIYQGVLCCTGHHADMHKPEFPGLKDFQGDVRHSHDYRVPDGFDNKRVLIIGIGNSGGDIAVELSRRAQQVYLSTRRGTWILNRVGDSGLPVDTTFIRRPIAWLNERFPAFLGKITEWKINSRVDHDLYSLRPDYGPSAQHPMVNDDMPNRIVCGAIKIKADVKRFTSTGVEFVDGTFEDNIDNVILATGYSFGFPYIDKEIIDVKDNHVQLYKYMYPPELEHQTLAVIGCFQPLGAIMPISEMQCRLATRVIKKQVKLPSRGEMWGDIREKEAAMAKRYTASRRHTIQVDHITFLDQLAELVGCKPDIVKLLTTDPLLGWQVLFGPVTPYQFRLTGPHPWLGARQAIMTQWDRLSAPLKSRPLPKRTENSLYFLKVFSLLLLAYFFIRFLFL